jgi:hypothetical protein
MEGLFRTNSAYFGPFRSGHFLDRVSVTEMDPASYPTLPFSGKVIDFATVKGSLYRDLLATAPLAMGNY